MQINGNVFTQNQYPSLTGSRAAQKQIREVFNQ